MEGVNQLTFPSQIPFMKKLLFAAFSLLMASCVMAQQKVVADKIVGIVGDKIVLKSEIFIANEDIKRQGGQEQDPCTILDGCSFRKPLFYRPKKILSRLQKKK